MPKRNEGLPKNIDHIIAELEELVDNSISIALTSRIVVNVDDIKRIIEDLNLNVPQEIMEAKAIATDRSEILSAAKREGERIVAKANEQSARSVAKANEQAKRIVDNANAQAARLVDEHKIVQTAREKADNILSEAKAQANLTIATAQEKADAIMSDAKQYSDETTEQADRWAREMRTAASNFADNAMRESEEVLETSLAQVLERSLAEVRRVRENLAKEYKEFD